MGIIYKAVNQKNDKIYIGQTRYKLEDRIKDHLSCCRKRPNTYFYNSLRKYKDNFSWEIITECSNEKLNELEIYYIKLYDSCNSGYNCTSGGYTALTKKVLKKMSKTKTGVKLSKEHREKISKGCKNIPRTEEWNEKNRNKHCRYLWFVETPDNEKFYLLNLKKFCKENKISFSWLTENGSCRGYKAIKIEEYVFSE